MYFIDSSCDVFTIQAIIKEEQKALLDATCCKNKRYRKLIG